MNNLEQKGGADQINLDSVILPKKMETPIVNPIVTNIKNTKNDPSISKIQKQITFDSIDEDNVEVKSKKEFTPKYQRQDSQQAPVAQQKTNHAMQQFYSPTTAMSYAGNAQFPVPHQNVYNITLPGPTGQHVEMNKIYEIALPAKGSTFTYNTIGERTRMYEFIRSFLVKIHDGEDICLDSAGPRSILSYLKFMNINPVSYNLLEKNPYRTLPFGLLIYNSCFPIQLQEDTGRIACAKNSVGINIRLYALTMAEYYSFKYKHKFYREYDVWRELIYYEYVRENIIKPRISPNFVMEYLYLNSPSKTIDFYSLKTKQLTQKQMMTSQYQRFLQMNRLLPDTKDNIFNMTQVENMGMMNNSTKLPDEVNPALQCYSGNTLVILTEAPTQNLYQWASHVFEKKGLVEKMISYGIHDSNVWFSIIFQISAALHVMQKFGIYIRNMSIEDNVYIRDLKSGGNVVGYWKYIIDGIPYYVPNYGYLVLIDTNFKDIYSETTSLLNQKRSYKIYANRLYGKKYNEEVIKSKIFENYKKIVTSNAFTIEYTQNNVIRPPEDVMKLLDRVTADQEMNISVSIFNNMKHYLHNRIGTFLKNDIEIPNIRDIDHMPNRGDLVIEVIGTNAYKFCMLVENLGNGIVVICTKVHPSHKDYITRQVSIDTLKQYAEGEVVEQKFNPLEHKLAENDLLETYIS